MVTAIGGRVGEKCECFCHLSDHLVLRMKYRCESILVQLMSLMVLPSVEYSWDYLCCEVAVDTFFNEINECKKYGIYLLIYNNIY
jgi:hypothetical protein